jgi:hypothetical protein
MIFLFMKIFKVLHTFNQCLYTFNGAGIVNRSTESAYGAVPLIPTMPRAFAKSMNSASALHVLEHYKTYVHDGNDLQEQRCR